jgi:serine/threonine protein kinase
MRDRTSDVETIFLAALEKTASDERTAYIDEACRGDVEMRARVLALLQAHEAAGSFLGKPPVDVAVTAASEDLHSPMPEETPLDFLEPCDVPGCLGTLGHYEITEVVGRGGMGIVLKGHDPKLNRVVAIKVLAPHLAVEATARRRFLREAQAAAAVSHDHVVTIHAIDDGQQLPFLVMEYVSGQSLQQRIDRSGPLELKEILRIGKQMASGLAAAHSEGLIHRDVKPANILLENSVERVKITDFGLARAANDASMTETGIVAGTPEYMSPEQAQGLAVDHRSDLFSLGCVLYAMCTGRSPFRANSAVAVIRRVCDDTPRPVQEVNSEIPDWLVRIIERLLTKGPDERLQSAAEVADLLGGHLAHLQRPTGAARPASDWLGRPRVQSRFSSP